MTFHEKLARLVEDRKQAAVSRRAGLPPCTVANLLFKKQMPAADRAFRLARVLGVSLEWLMDDAREWPPMPAEHPEFAGSAA